MNKTTATPSRCHVDITTVNELTKAFEIPPAMIKDSPQSEVIGEGRFGTCTKAFLHGTLVCAKILQSCDSPSYHTKAAILHEAAILSKVRHPPICFLAGIQTTKEPFQLITVFYSVNNVSLSVYDTLSVAKLTEAKRHALELVRPSLTLQVWLAIMKNLAEALAFSHSKSIVHRDLKSDNVVLNKQGDSIHCVLVDFGKSNYVTKVRRYQLSEKEKEQYRRDHKHIAPDLVDGISDVSTASDMYSYGRVLKNIIIYFPLPIEAINTPIKKAIKQCLMYSDAERPTAQHLVQLLTET